MRLFTVEVPEPVVEHAIARGLLRQEDRAEPWPVIQAWFAAFLSDTVLNCSFTRIGVPLDFFP
jgi:hypothetical protein